MIDQALYDKYFKAALKFTCDPKKHAYLVPQRPVLEGVLHHTDGSLIASDTVRMICIRDAQDRCDGAVLAKGGKDLKDSGFPDFTRLLHPASDVEVVASIDDWINGHRLMDIIVADRIDEERVYTVDDKKKTARLKNHRVQLSLNQGYSCMLGANWDSVGSGRHEFEEQATGTMQIIYNAKLMIEALKVLKSFGHESCTLRFKSSHRGFSNSPFTIAAGNVWIMQMPLRGV